MFRKAEPLCMRNLVKPDMQLSTEKENAAGPVGLEMKRTMTHLLL